jgi:hypothetical protein
MKKSSSKRKVRAYSSSDKAGTGRDERSKPIARITIENSREEHRSDNERSEMRHRDDDDRRHEVRHDQDSHKHREHHEHAHCEASERVKIDIDVDVRCCPCEPPPTGGENGQPGRPVHTTGPSDGSLNGQPPTLGGVVGLVGNGRDPNGPWPGPRKDLPLPYLFMRANPGDTGTRPVIGAFWESPDIFLLPGVAPQLAPAIPATLGGVAQANADNTIYAHVWNFGLAPSYEVLVEFYWFNPTLGFNSNSANLIGRTFTHFGARSSTTSHKVVKCPSSWRANYVNGGHECLVVRISDVAADPLSTPEWDASQNRHVAQRNIHVMTAAEAQSKPTIGIAVGPLFGAPAIVQVARADPGTMPWLHLITMNRGATFNPGPGTGTVGLTPPTATGGPVPNLGGVPDPAGAGLVAGQQTVQGDDQQIGFHANDPAPGRGQANVYRVSAVQNGQAVGGYTVVVVGS